MNRRFRIDEDLRLAAFLFLGDVDHQQAQRLADLDRGKPDARRVIHGFQHVVGEFENAGIDLFQGLEPGGVPDRAK